MERKILWLISFALIFVMWLKIEPIKKPQEKKPQPQLSEAETGDSVGTTEALGEATRDEVNYFKSHPIKEKAPDFAAITDVKERKSTFFNYLVPFVHEKNNLILNDRKRIQSILDNEASMSSKDKNWLASQRKNYRLKAVKEHSKDSIQELLNRLDIIPASLVLAQSANESAWGTSRFALKGNNFFGQWCFRKGCGLVPESRDSDADHEVRKFHDARESVFAYVDNLNTNNAYKKLRATRLTLRKEGKDITGLDLASGLIHYSQRGQAYVDEIKGLIEYNNLWRFNK
ncbi:glucosaminidase domain-containing protein [Marinomonas transparens]|uniref:Glucosaminidase domain-containing protein n=1 Tax=Marinomonas transparens TaxID=2795388 RepID=A0A934JW23_9GAMM|nr:glucosaminidase domain-containing protein [Marinomonas transparens]MBJ7538340.1 glucosaminidase domain-containing protein [Marinomonas transparens]